MEADSPPPVTEVPPLVAADPPGVAKVLSGVTPFSPADAPPHDADTCHEIAVDLQSQGRRAEAETWYRAALSLAPDRSDSWANLGLTILHAGRADEAIECQREALRLDPENVEAFNNLGIAMHTLNALPEAENHFRGALRLVPNHANAMLNLGVIRQSLGRMEEAELLYRQARALGVDEARVCNNLALTLVELGRPDEAETICRAALAANPDYPEAAVNLGMILLMLGRLEEGWPWYEARWRVAPLLSRPRPPDETRWTGAEPIDGKTVLLLSEQGFGDVLQFCRYAPLVARRGARVILGVPDTLARLMGSLEGVDSVVSRDDPPPPFDLHCPLMSLPLAFDTTEETIPWRVPYLAAAPEAIDRWRASLPASRARRIGLVWAGGRRPEQPHAAAIDRRRSMRLAEMAPLAAVQDCVFVSLQLGPAAAQIATAPFPIVDLTDRLIDFAETAALVETLDLIIGVDTAVAHLAGALGKPVWLLNRFDGCWRWGQERDDTPWYPTMRLFRQTTPGDWEGVMARVTDALIQFWPTG